VSLVILFRTVDVRYKLVWKIVRPVKIKRDVVFVSKGIRLCMVSVLFVIISVVIVLKGISYKIRNVL